MSVIVTPAKARPCPTSGPGHRGAGAPRRERLAGLRRARPGAKYNENRAFSPRKATAAAQSLVISAAYAENSLLSGSIEDQWNFAADQRIGAALSSEEQRNSCRL